MTSQQRPALQTTLGYMICTEQIPGVRLISVGSRPTMTIVINALTFGTELNGLRAIQRVVELADRGKLDNAKIFLVAAHPAAALAGVDDFGRSLNRLPLEHASQSGGPDMSRVAELRTFFSTQRVDVVCDFQENGRAPPEGLVLDIAGDDFDLRQQVCESLPCSDRFTGITGVQRCSNASSTSPFATIFDAKASVEVLLPKASREDGSVEGIVDALLVGLDVLSAKEMGSVSDTQRVYEVFDAYSGVKDHSYTVSMLSLLGMHAPVCAGDILAVDDNGKDHIVARNNGSLIFGPSQRNFVGTGHEVWWQVVKKDGRTRTRRAADV